MSSLTAEQHEGQNRHHEHARPDSAHRLKVDHRNAHEHAVMYGTSHASHTKVLNA